MKAGSRRAVAAVALLAAGLSIAGCDTPDDEIFTPPIVAPIEVDGRFRVTFNTGADVVRGVTRDGARILYRSQGLTGFGPEWRILSIPATGGEVREEAGLYRAALRDSIAQLRFDAGGRTLVTWKFGPAGIGSCGPPAAVGPTAMLLVVFRLDEVDGRPVAALPTRVIPTPSVIRSFIGPLRMLHLQVTILPAELEIRTFGVDPYGPAVDQVGIGYLSDGTTIWRLDLADPTLSPDSIAQGVFPALSTQGDQLAFSVPTGLSSVTDTTVVPFGLGSCTQETITIRASGWDVVLYDLAAGTSVLLGEGVEPQFDPAGGRVVVRRPDGLYWIDVGTGGASFIAGTEGAYSAAVSPDGSFLAFSARGGGSGHDVFLLPLN